MKTPVRFGIIPLSVPGSFVRMDLKESERNRTISRWPGQKDNKRNTKYYAKVGEGDSISPSPGKILLNCTELDFLDFLDWIRCPIPQFPAQTRKLFSDQSNFCLSGSVLLSTLSADPKIEQNRTILCFVRFRSRNIKYLRRRCRPSFDFG
jgi:hypothetical protein